MDKGETCFEKKIVQYKRTVRENFLKMFLAIGQKTGKKKFFPKMASLCKQKEK